MRPRAYIALRVAFAAIGLGFIGLALNAALRDPNLTVIPQPGALAFAVAIVVLGLWAAVAGWARLLGSGSIRVVARGFLMAQLGKYVPGGIWQVIGQVGHAASATPGGGRRATVAYLSSVVSQITAGLLVGVPIAFFSDTPQWVRVGVAVATGAALLLIIDHRLLSRVLLALPWIRQESSAEQPAMPTRAAMLFATGTGVLSMVAAGTVFVVAYAAPAGEYLAAVGPAYALAWTIGFLAIPFPAGLGVREAALLMLIPGGSATAIVAASAVVRVVYIVGELVAIGTAIAPIGRFPTARTTGAHDGPGPTG